MDKEALQLKIQKIMKNFTVPLKMKKLEGALMKVQHELHCAKHTILQYQKQYGKLENNLIKLQSDIDASDEVKHLVKITGIKNKEHSLQLKNIKQAEQKI